MHHNTKFGSCLFRTVLDTDVFLDLLLEVLVMLDLVHEHLILANIATIQGQSATIFQRTFVSIPLGVVQMTSLESNYFSAWPPDGSDQEIVISTKPSEIVVLALVRGTQKKRLLNPLSTRY